jgi:hypothetical protein
MSFVDEYIMYITGIYEKVATKSLNEKVTKHCMHITCNLMPTEHVKAYVVTKQLCKIISTGEHTV